MNMRTTLNLDDDVLVAVKTYAESRSLGLGKAASELLRRGITSATPTRKVNGLLVFELPPGSPKVTRATVKRLRDEL